MSDDAAGERRIYYNGRYYDAELFEDMCALNRSRGRRSRPSMTTIMRDALLRGEFGIVVRDDSNDRKNDDRRFLDL